MVPLIPDDQTSLAFVSKLNGVVFPGGQGDYNLYGQNIMNSVKIFNSKDLYPVFGIDQGFQNMIKWAASSGSSVISNYSAH